MSKTKIKRVELTPNRRVALYCRVAREDDEAITMQKNILQDYAEKQGHMNISVYADNGESGVNFYRPALSQLEDDIQEGIVGTVIVLSFDRLGRDFIKAENWIARIRLKGVSFISISDGIDDSSFDKIKFAKQELYKALLAYSRKTRCVMRRSRYFD